MLLRNYDNYQAVRNMITCGTTSNYNSYLYSEMNDEFGDNYLSFKDVNGGIIKVDSFYNGVSNPFMFYQNANALNVGQPNLMCGYTDNDVSYDDYTIDNVNTSLIFVSHSVTKAKCNDNNEVECIYTKILSNSSTEDIVINCIGLVHYVSGKGCILLYKEKIPEVTISAGANVVLTFTTKVPLGQNRPADYVASASVE